MQSPTASGRGSLGRASPGPPAAASPAAQEPVWAPSPTLARLGSGSRQEALSAGRLVGLDVLRGLAGTVVLFCATGGGGYWWLQDSQWDGVPRSRLNSPQNLTILLSGDLPAGNAAPAEEA